MSVSFRGQQRADDEGKRKGSTPIKYAVKQEDFIGGEGFGAFGLDITLIVCRPSPEDKETDIGSELRTKSGSRETRRGKILGIGYAGIGVRKTAAARCHGRMKRDEKEGYESTFTPSASSSSTMTPVSSV